MSYLYPVPAEVHATNFLSRNIKLNDYVVYVAGHSKGGRLALTSSMEQTPFKKFQIEYIFNFDGPGIIPELINTKKYHSILKKVRNYYPEESIVGMILESQGKKTIIKSDGFKIYQHSIHTWLINKTEFQKGTLSKESKEFHLKIENVINKFTIEERKYFTLVLKSMLTLANAKFLFGCRGSNLDILAREPLWEDGVDYRCGTGHGVGYFLGVHEGPNAFRWRSNPENLDAVLQPGMVITDEPGVYVPGKYGIRTENMLICKKWQQNEYGAFLHFEPLTLVPIDLDGVDLSLFNEKEQQLLTDYQQFVYETLSPHLNEEESAWLHTLTL